MISPELIRRYPLFAGLNAEEMLLLAQAGDEIALAPGQFLFQEGDRLQSFYLVVEGSVDLILELTDRGQPPLLAQQFLRTHPTREIVVTVIGPGNMFGWSGLIPPYITTAGARAERDSRIIAFDCRQLRTLFEENCHFGYRMTVKAAQAIRDRLRDMRIETLSQTVAQQQGGPDA